MLSMRIAIVMIYLISFLGMSFFPTCRLVNALLSEDIRDISLGYQEVILGVRLSRATYAHLGRMAAMILAPSTPRRFDARLRLVMAPMSGMALARAVTPVIRDNR
jgi:hypothetical protein